jgi:hypothetical protein
MLGLEMAAEWSAASCGLGDAVVVESAPPCLQIACCTVITLGIHWASGISLSDEAEFLPSSSEVEDVDKVNC